MRTLNPYATTASHATTLKSRCEGRLRRFAAVLPRSSHSAVLLVGIVMLGIAGCSKDIASEASDSDANGYLCLKCDAKLYTPRTVFIGPKCPKCAENSLVEVVGYVCPKDGHLTLRGRSDDRRGALVCEQCKAAVSAMRLPREKDLKAWGASKAS